MAVQGLWAVWLPYHTLPHCELDHTASGQGAGPCLDWFGMSSGDYDGTDDYEAVAARDERRARAALRHERHATEAERAAERRADESEAALRRSVSRVKLRTHAVASRVECANHYTDTHPCDCAEAEGRAVKLAVAAARLVEMPCGHTVPSDPLRPDWCSACERLTGGVE